jgi:hypothetical protein
VWWHVRTGEWIIGHHRLPTVDTWSIGGSGHAWVAHSWLAEIVIACFYKAFGFSGLSAFRALGVVALLTCLAVQVFRRTNPTRALIVFTLALLATRGGWGERPQLFSFLLLVPTAELLRRAVARDGQHVFWLVPLTFLWANLHGLWFLCPALTMLGAYAALLLERAGARRPRFALRFLLVAALSACAAGLTPNGPTLLLQPLHVNAYGQFVSEWGPPDVHTLFGLAFFTMIVVLLLAYGRSERRIDPHTSAQVAFAIVLGLLYVRTVAPAAVLLTPLLADALGRSDTRRGGRLADPFARAALSAIVLLGFGGGALVLAAEPSLPPSAPVAATQAVLTAVPGEPRVVNEYSIGGWLLLFAQRARPAIDGRAEIYPISYVSDYYDLLRMRGDWRPVLARLHANCALLHPTTPLVNGLRDQLGWHVVYRDDTWLVLVPPGIVSS